MEKEDIQSKFGKIGAAVIFEDSRARSHLKRLQSRRGSLTVYDENGRPQTQDGKPNPNRRAHAPVIDLKRVGGRETFVVDVFDDPKATAKVLDVRPKERHLLLMVTDGESGEKAKYLIGHDEHHWFVAAIRESAHARNVTDAMDALKPARVLTRQAKAGVKAKARHRRKNDAYVRQGEWFFIPVPRFEQGIRVIHKDEPIQRGRGRPHICQELIRIGGSTVWVHPKRAPSGVSEMQAMAIRRKIGGRISDDRAEWVQRVADAAVYVRGYVKHPDHETIRLTTWHRVLANTENKAKAASSLRFLD